MYYGHERLEGEFAMIVPTDEGRVMLELYNGRVRLGQKSWMILEDMTQEHFTGYRRGDTELWAVCLWGELVMTMTSDIVDEKWIVAHKGGMHEDEDPLVALALAMNDLYEY